MRRSFGVIALGLAGCSLVACAALSGLDAITEDACAPDGCADAQGTLETATMDEASHEAAPSTPDTGRGGEASGSDPDVGAADTTTASAEAGADGAQEGALSEVGDADAAAETGPAADAAPDGPCGTVYLSETFDSTDGGWALDTTWSIAPTCPDPPAPQKGYPDPTTDHTTGAAGGVAGVYVCGNNPAGTTSAIRYATSPTVDVSAAPSVKLGFYRWLNSDASGWMTSTVDVFDGTTWVNVYTNPSGTGNVVTDSTWTKVEYDVTAQKNAAFRVRFGYAVPDSGVYSMSCWNIDDLTLSTGSCP
jgi:hypothetical protein